MFMRPIRVSIHEFISAKARSYVRGPSLRIYERVVRPTAVDSGAVELTWSLANQCLDSRWRRCWYAGGICVRVLPNNRSGSALRAVPAGAPRRAGLCVRQSAGQHQHGVHTAHLSVLNMMSKCIRCIMGMHARKAAHSTTRRTDDHRRHARREPSMATISSSAVDTSGTSLDTPLRCSRDVPEVRPPPPACERHPRITT